MPPTIATALRTFWYFFTPDPPQVVRRYQSLLGLIKNFPPAARLL
jgi:hypothetical protein